MRSLRSRLWLLWGLAAAAALTAALLSIALWRGSTLAETGRVRAVAAADCERIRERLAFYATGWTGTLASRDLAPVLIAALAGRDVSAAGIWSDAAGPLVSIPDPPPVARDRLALVNRTAGQADQPVQRRIAGQGREGVLAACPLGGPVDGLTGWTLLRVDLAPGLDRLRLALGVLLALPLAMALAIARLASLWGGKVTRIEQALAAHDLETLPVLPPTGERELDRIVAALNEAGPRLSRAQARAEAAERLAVLGRVAAGVAHEIRNPIAAMRLRAENALAGAPSRLEPAVRDSLVQIARIDRLVASLLGMARPPAPEPVTVRLAPLIAARVAEHAVHADGAGVELRSDAPDAQVRLDPELLGRTLDPLIENAIRHAGQGGSVRVCAAVLGDGAVRISIGDTGPGIDPALRPHLFEPFATGRTDGTGLGLAIARELAAAQSGRLEPEPRLPGAGAVFTLTLPGAASATIPR